MRGEEAEKKNKKRMKKRFVMFQRILILLKVLWMRMIEKLDRSKKKEKRDNEMRKAQVEKCF